MNAHLTKLVAAMALSGAVSASDITQLSFGTFTPASGTCELNELGFQSNQNALKFRGTIKREPRGFLCSVSLSQSQINGRFRYCSIAFIESPPTPDYVCGVMHLPGSIEFSYGFKYGSGAPPMCSFVCPGK